MEKQLKQSVLISYLIGAPIGVLVIFLVIVLAFVLTGEGLFTLAFLGGYGFATVGLLLSFFVALFFGGKTTYRSIKKGDSLNRTSFKYSLAVNIIIWFVFCAILFIQHLNDFTFFVVLLIPPTIAFGVSVIVSTFIIGLLITSRIRKNIIK